jgi:molybdopterin-guanine dinucleotide biosynthesis protein A
VKRYRQVAAFILGGGASSRMGRDKGLLELGGVPLIVRTVTLVKPLVATVTIVGTPHRYAALGLHAIEDPAADTRDGKRTGKGPLAGISRALATTHAPWNLILACDLPYLTSDWLDWFLSRALASQAQVVIPRTRHGFEPLAAVYRRECGAMISAALARGTRKVTAAFKNLHLDPVYTREWREIDPVGRVLKNMNDPRDYAEARRWWQRQGITEINQEKRQPATSPQRTTEQEPRAALRRRR